MLIRRYKPEDRETVRGIHAVAFRRPGDPGGTPAEVGLLDRLIEADDVIGPLSLVAVRQAGPVGHVVCSRATTGGHPVAALGPIAVHPEHQRQGVGVAMMHAALAAADALEIPLVALLGSRDYYPRFGFVPAAQLAIESPDTGWGDDFQVRTLSAYHPRITGRFRYAAAFDSV